MALKIAFFKIKLSFKFRIEAKKIHFFPLLGKKASQNLGSQLTAYMSNWFLLHAASHRTLKNSSDVIKTQVTRLSTNTRYNLSILNAPE